MNVIQPYLLTACILDIYSTQLNSTLFIEHFQDHEWNQSAVQNE